MTIRTILQKFPRRTSAVLALLCAGLLAAGCGHRAAAPVQPPAAAVSTPVEPTKAATGNFQPYTLLPKPAPKPKVATRKNRTLHLVMRDRQPYLVDSQRHYYRVGRDKSGNLYPIYRDPATGKTYPLYYDPDRDRLYRIARADDGRYYRGYVGDPGNRYYASDRDYSNGRPSDEDRSVTNISDYGVKPTIQGTHHNNSAWLLAIPVLVGAYFLLKPHHSSPPPRYAIDHRPPTTIVRNINNSHVTVNNRAINNHSVIIEHGRLPTAPHRPIVPHPLTATHHVSPMPRPAVLPQHSHAAAVVPTAHAAPPAKQAAHPPAAAPRAHRAVHPVAAAPPAKRVAHPAAAVPRARQAVHPVAAVPPHNSTVIRPAPRNIAQSKRVPTPIARPTRDRARVSVVRHEILPAARPKSVVAVPKTKHVMATPSAPTRHVVRRTEAPAPHAVVPAIHRPAMSPIRPRALAKAHSTAPAHSAPAAMTHRSAHTPQQQRREPERPAPMVRANAHQHAATVVHKKTALPAHKPAQTKALPKPAGHVDNNIKQRGKVDQAH